MWTVRGSDDDVEGEDKKGKERMPKRGEDPSSGEVLRYFDGEPDFFA